MGRGGLAERGGSVSKVVRAFLVGRLSARVRVNVWVCAACVREFRLAHALQPEIWTSGRFCIKCEHYMRLPPTLFSKQPLLLPSVFFLRRCFGHALRVGLALSDLECDSGVLHGHRDASVAANSGDELEPDISLLAAEGVEEGREPVGGCGAPR